MFLHFLSFAIGGFFSVTFYRPIDFVDWLELKKHELGERRVALLEALREQPTLTIRPLTERIGSSIRSVERDIAFLKSIGILERLGCRSRCRSKKCKIDLQQ